MKSEDGLFTHKVIHCFQQVLVVRCCFFAPFTVQSREPYDPRNGFEYWPKSAKKSPTSETLHRTFCELRIKLTGCSSAD
jgi:hypothetical protein